MPTRRYNDDEVAEILKRATETGSTALARTGSGSGLSLTELQSIGEEAGIAPEAIAHAAHALDHPAAPATTRMLGFPIGVGDSVEVDRKLSETEWAELVAAARQTFNASGRLRQDGAFRQWSNGNLRMMLEPTSQGTRIVLRTYNGNARRMLVGGSLMTLGGAALAVASQFNLWAAGRLSGAMPLIAVGVAMFAIGAVPLGAWAQRRRDQFKRLVERIND